MQYQHLSIEEREKIQTGIWEKKSIRTIADELGRSPATISREIRRNLPPERHVYAPRLAHERATMKYRLRGRRFRLKDPFIQKYVLDKLRGHLSPEQIAGRLHYDHPRYRISPEAIYQYIYAQYNRNGYGRCIGLNLRKYLKRRHKQRRRKYRLLVPEKGIKNRIWIDVRPRAVDRRRQQGHWEGDSIVSKKSTAGLNTLVERVSGLVCISKIRNTKKNETTRTVIGRMQRLPARLRKTLTVDNGHENGGHEEIVRALGMNCYFAHPYHSWERGTNENTNGLVRWYLPKGTDFARVSAERIRKIEHRLNNRPRKRLGWRTPLEVFNHGVALKC